MLLEDAQEAEDELSVGHKKLFFEIPVSVMPLKVTGLLIWQKSKQDTIIFVFMNNSPFLILIYCSSVGDLLRFLFLLSHGLFGRAGVDSGEFDFS